MVYCDLLKHESSALNTEAVCSSKTMISAYTTRCLSPKNHTIYNSPTKEHRFEFYPFRKKSCYSSAVLLRAGWLGFNSRQGQEIFFYSTASRLAQDPTQLLIQWVPGLFPRGWSRQGVKLTTHLHLVLRSRMVELYLQSPIHLHGVVLNN
jgi:hypothetical protein